MSDTLRHGGVIRVLGVGNVLVGDDALGPYVVRVLESTLEPDEAVEVLDVGTPGLDFTPYLVDARAVIVVDTVRADAAPGSLRRYTRDAILAAPPPSRMSPHEPGLREALMATELTDSSPGEVVLIGVVPECLENTTGLSPTVSAALGAVVEAVVEELRRLGVEPRWRSEPGHLDIWWERGSREAGK